jgi:hypothetical protein
MGNVCNPYENEWVRNVRTVFDTLLLTGNPIPYCVMHVAFRRDKKARY